MTVFAEPAMFTLLGDQRPMMQCCAFYKKYGTCIQCHIHMSFSTIILLATQPEYVGGADPIDSTRKIGSMPADARFTHTT